MSENKTIRPKNLDLLHIRLPIGGVVSILHRVSGVLLVLGLPVAMLLLQQSLQSPEDFTRIRALFGSVPARVFILLGFILLTHHFLAGARHLLLDLDVGISRAGGRLGAWLVLAGVAGATLIAGGCLFL